LASVSFDLLKNVEKGKVLKDIYINPKARLTCKAKRRQKRSDEEID
jgi:hypothetical protein